MNFQAYCPRCEKKATASTLLSGDKLKHALAIEAVMEVMHLSAEKPDHRCHLIEHEKKNLRTIVGQKID
jgi:hypothetical protein